MAELASLLLLGFASIYVGCTMHNDECHMAFLFSIFEIEVDNRLQFFPPFKLEVGRYGDANNRFWVGWLVRGWVGELLGFNV